MDKRIIVSAPGKIILSGEHSVVYGYPGLLTAVDRRCFVEICRQDKSGVTVEDWNFGAKDFSLREIRDFWEKTELSWVEFDKTNNIAELSFVKADVFGLVKLSLAVTFSEINAKNGGLALRIKSDIPIGSGMGSSAAIAVSLIGALLKFLKDSLDREKINKLAFEVEKKIHGNPSGGDNTIVTYGGLLVFKKGEGFEKLSLRGQPDFDFLVVQTGRPVESTGEMVAVVSSKLKAYSSKLKTERLLKSIGQVTNKIIQSFKGGDFSQLKWLVWQNERLLERLGVVAERAKRLIKELEDQKAAAKICGAGGVKENSGIVLVLADNLEKMKRFLTRKKLENFKIKINQEGVRVEKS